MMGTLESVEPVAQVTSNGQGFVKLLRRMHILMIL